MKNNYLVPQILIDIGDKLAASTNQNERANLKMRIEACRDYITTVLYEDAKRDVREAVDKKAKNEHAPKTGFSRVGRNNV